MTSFVAPIANRLSLIFEIDHHGHSPFRAMEGLRGVAVTLVFLVHFITLLDPWLGGAGVTFALAQGLRAVGHAGVDLFFVLSGFLIYGTLISKEKAFFPYIKRRFERIYPTFLVVFFIYLLLSYLYPQESKIPEGFVAGISYIAVNLLLLPGIFDITPIITVAWSLSYEMFFYLAIPLAIAGMNLRCWTPEKRIIFFTILAMAILVMNLFQGFHVRFAMFITGIILWDSLKICKFNLDKIGLLAFFIGLISIHALHTSELPGMLRYAVLSVTFYLLCVACLGRQGAAYNIFCWKPIRWLGNMSYSYYLVHGLVLKASFMFLGKIFYFDNYSGYLFWLLLVPMFVLTLIISALLFVFIERPMSLESKGKGRYSFLKSFNYY